MGWPQQSPCRRKTQGRTSCGDRPCGSRGSAIDWRGEQLVLYQGDFDDRHSERPLRLRSGQAAGAKNLCYAKRQLLQREILRRYRSSE